MSRSQLDRTAEAVREAFALRSDFPEGTTIEVTTAEAVGVTAVQVTAHVPDTEEWMYWHTTKCRYAAIHEWDAVNRHCTICVAYYPTRQTQMLIDRLRGIAGTVLSDWEQRRVAVIVVGATRGYRLRM